MVFFTQKVVFLRFLRGVLGWCFWALRWCFGPMMFWPHWTSCTRLFFFIKKIAHTEGSFHLTRANLCQDTDMISINIWNFMKKIQKKIEDGRLRGAEKVRNTTILNLTLLLNLFHGNFASSTIELVEGSSGRLV